MSLFPEMDRDISDGRKAERRERVQRARHYLRGRNLSWLINYLLEHGPRTEHLIMIERMDEERHLDEASKAGLNVLVDLYSLWLVRKLWRRPAGIHPGSGEESFVYGIRGVHKPAN